MMGDKVIIRQITEKGEPILYSQVLHLRNQLLRLPIGLDLFQEDLSQEENHVTLAATIRADLAKSNDNNPNPPTSHPPTNSKDISGDHADKNGESQTPAPPQQEVEEKVVGCVILAPLDGDEETCKLRQMAVSPDFQGQGLGSKLVDNAEQFARQRGKRKIALHGRKHAVGFYLRKGYKKIHEEEFLELGIPHYALEKNLE